MRKIVTAMMIASALTFGTAACNTNPPRAFHEVEDCDYEDRLEGDEDCEDSVKHKTKKKSSAKKYARSAKKFSSSKSSRRR